MDKVQKLSSVDDFDLYIIRKMVNNITSLRRSSNTEIYFSDIESNFPGRKAFLRRVLKKTSFKLFKNVKKEAMDGTSLHKYCNISWCHLRWGMTWKLHIERTVVKALDTYMRTYFLFKSKHLSSYIKHILHKAVIKSTMIYACPAWEYAADAHIFKDNACRTEFSTLLATFTSTHQSMIRMWLSKFLTCTIT
jgi:hypothetical protein